MQCWFLAYFSSSCHCGLKRPMQSWLCVCVCVCVCVWTSSLIHQVSYRNQEALCVTIPLTVSCLAVFSPSCPYLVALDCLSSLERRLKIDGITLTVREIVKKIKEGPVCFCIQPSVVDPQLNRLVAGELCCWMVSVSSVYCDSYWTGFGHFYTL